MKMVEQLPEELLWAEGGHASDIALTSLADAQYEIVPKLVMDHVADCPACTSHLGNAALLSLHTARQMQIARTAEAPRVSAEIVHVRKPLPRFAIAIGLAVAGVGLVPSFLDGTSPVSSASSFAHHVPLFLHGLKSSVSQVAGSNLGLFVTYGTALLLVTMGVAVVRLLPKKETSR